MKAKPLAACRWRLCCLWKHFCAGRHLQRYRTAIKDGGRNIESFAVKHQSAIFMPVEERVYFVKVLTAFRIAALFV